MKTKTRAAICAVSRSTARAILLVLVSAVSVVAQEAARGGGKHKSVLVLFSDDSKLPPQIIVEQSLRSTLKNGSPVPVEIYSEYLDARRTHIDGYEKELVGLLRRKYEGRKFDLIVTVSTPALRLLLKYQPEIFPDTPVVFYVLDQRNLAGLNPGPNMTGTWGEINFKPNLDTALELHPNTRKVVVVVGVSEFDKYWTAKVREDFLVYEGKLEIAYLIGLSISELQRALAGLPPQTVVLFITTTQDNAGNNHDNLDVLRQISAGSSAPIYGSTDAQLGLGIVGGSVISFEAIGAETARLGLRVLAGEQPQAIAPHGVPNVVMFDWRELRRWGISEQSLPPGSIVRFKQPTIWEQYKWHILGAILLFIVETLLIIWLLYIRAKRRKAERESERFARLVEAEHKRLDEVVSNTPGVVWEALVDRETGARRLHFVSDYIETLLGYSVEEWLSTPGMGTSLVDAEDRDVVVSAMDSVVNEGQGRTLEFRWLAKDGKPRWVETNVVPIRDEAGKTIGLRGFTLDISDRKESDEALRQSEARFKHMADTAPVIIFVTDADMFCTFFNQYVFDFTERSNEELLGNGWLQMVHEDDRERCVNIYLTAQAARKPFVMEFRARRADGALRWIFDTAVPRFASDGEFLGYIGTGVDITDRKSAEEALHTALEEVNKLKNQLAAENVYLQEEIKLAHNFEEIVGRSDAIKYVLFKIEQVAPTDSTVLILGETGTGKELVARAIHSASPRKDRPLVKVNCAALSASLIESELFGHEKGAFTGASARKVGRFELAHGATLFLDEIGELPLELQSKLLRVLQEGEFERLGSSKTIKADVRIIAATNRNLQTEMREGRFREDLWYRLNVFPITVPPLKQRAEDIPLLVEHFVKSFSKRLGREITSISPATLRTLSGHTWPGNIRELANVVERAVINARGPVLSVVDGFDPPPAEQLPAFGKSLEEIERHYILATLEETGWRIEGPKGAAKILGLNPSTLRTRMAKLGIQKQGKSMVEA